MTLWLLFLILFPKEGLDIKYEITGAMAGEAKVLSDGKQFRLDFPGKTVFWNGKDLYQLDGSSWTKVKGILYAKENFPTALFLETEKLVGFSPKPAWTLLGGKLSAEASFDAQGLVSATLTHEAWGKAVLKRASAVPLKEIPPGAFPEKKSGLLSGMSGLKGMLGMGDQKDVSATAGARGVGEEANLDAPPNYAAVDQVEKMAVNSSDVDVFAQAGGLK